LELGDKGAYEIIDRAYMSRRRRVFATAPGERVDFSKVIMETRPRSAPKCTLKAAYLDQVEAIE
jgi:hypothetical protein